jgi:ferredoxin
MTKERTASGVDHHCDVVQNGVTVMRVKVDLNRCQAYAQCCFLAPDVFKLHGKEVLLHVSEPDEAYRLQVLRAASACPVRAITVDADAVGAAIRGDNT